MRGRNARQSPPAVLHDCACASWPKKCRTADQTSSSPVTVNAADRLPVRRRASRTVPRVSEVAVARVRARRHLEVAGVVDEARSSASSSARRAARSRGAVLAVGCVEQVDVVARRADSARRSISRTFAEAVDANVPPVPVTWKNSSSSNSQASVVCATNTISRCGTGGAGPAPPRRRTTSRACGSRSPMLPDTSISRNTTACVVGCSRRCSCRKRRSSSVNDRRILLHGAAFHRFAQECDAGRAASARRGGPSPRAIQSSSARRRRVPSGSGSCISSQSQSTMSSTLNSSTNSMPPSSSPPAPRWPRRRVPARRQLVARLGRRLVRRLPAGPARAAGSDSARASAPARAPSLAAGTSTSAPAMISGRCARTASRTFSLWRSQSRAPRENRSYQPRVALNAISHASPAPPCARVRRHSCASSVVT